MNETLELQPMTKNTVALRDDDLDPIMRYAIDHKADPAVVQKMMDVRREIRAERAKEAFDAAMRDFQADCPILTKGKTVRNDAGSALYQYSPLEDILTKVKPLLQKHGFSFTLDTDTESKDGWVIAKCTVTHCAGHSLTSTAKFPLGAGTRLMSTTQVYASALTFASRRVFCNAFGLITGGEDRDGNMPKEKPVGPAVATEETRKRMIARLTAAVGEQRLYQYAIDTGLIEPTASIETWPLDKVPLTTKPLAELQKKVEAHQ
jgi:hypothetical protein